MKDFDRDTQSIPEAQVVRDVRVASPHQPHPPAGGGLNPRDILAVIYRHKGKIALLGALGIAAAATVYLTRTPLYASQAKIFVPYVLERKGIDEIGTQGGSEVTSASGTSGRMVLNAEVDLLTSWDLAEDVVDSVGVETIMHGANPDTDVAKAALAVLDNLIVEIPKDSVVLRVSYQHPDPVQARAILGILVEAYLTKHKETHRSTRSLDVISAKAGEVKNALDAALKSLEDLKKTENIISLENRETILTSRQATVEEQLLDAQGKQAEQIARVHAAEALNPESTDPESTDPEAVEDTPIIATPSNADIEDYRSLVSEIDGLRSQRSALRLKFTESNSSIRAIQNQLDAAEVKRKALVEKFPALVAAVRSKDGSPTADVPLDPRLERAALTAIDAQVEFLNAESLKVQDELSKLLKNGSLITKLEREIAEHQENYTRYQAALARGNEDLILKPSQMENITIIQPPSVATRTTADSIKKIVLGLAFGGFGLGIGIAFLIEMFLDRSIKRPQEIETGLQLPLMLSIPYLIGERQAPLRLQAGGGNEKRAGRRRDAEPDGSVARETAPATPWESGHFIRPFADAIRDRVEYQFQVTGVIHKPKLVGLTGFSDGSGTSTLAASLAASFAATTEGKILYVNLNCGAPLPNRGDAPHSTTSEALGEGKESIGVTEHKDNLFIASLGEDSPNGEIGGFGEIDEASGASAPPSRTFIPKRLYELMPQFKASDFEYIIFDMPPLGPTSPTVAMAGFMDKVLLVVDAGKTDRDIVRRSYRELSANGKGDVSTILNKTRESLPTWLQG